MRLSPLTGGVAVLCALFISSCEPMEMNTVCTQEFKMWTVTVLSEQTGAAVDSLSITVTDKSSGYHFELCSQESSVCTAEGPARGDGKYLIFHDGFLDMIEMEGEAVVVEGRKGDIGFSRDYTFGSDDCHIHKMAGPDTVYVSTASDAASQSAYSAD